MGVLEEEGGRTPPSRERRECQRLGKLNSSFVLACWASSGGLPLCQGERCLGPGTAKGQVSDSLGTGPRGPSFPTSSRTSRDPEAAGATEMGSAHGPAPNAKEEPGRGYLHVALVGVHSVEKGLWRHPLDRKPPLRAGETGIMAPSRPRRSGAPP